MGHSPLDDLISAIMQPGVDGLSGIGNGSVRPDLNREGRTGVPEVIYATGKHFDDIREAATVFVERTGRAIVSRLADPTAQRLVEHFASHDTRYEPRARMLVIRSAGFQPSPGGRVGVITAGTSDLPVAIEAKIVAEEMGCTVTLISDVGVAGIHRLFGPLRSLLESGVDAIVVAAGMDGALPSVVSGLVDVPVIGVPTSTGYGVGGNGVAALLSMLQTCAPGLSVVNVDNGVGAGVNAALVANRVARARRT